MTDARQSTRQPIIELDDIHKSFADVEVLKGVSLTANSGDVISIIGSSGSGKSTIGQALERKLLENGFFAQMLDGDNIRSGINANLGFSLEDRHENIRRIAETARLFVDAGMIVLTSFISPFKSERRLARELLEEGEFIEIFVNTPLEICEVRDLGSS